MGDDQEAKIERLTQLLRERLRQEWPKGKTDVSGVEEIVGRVERDVLREVTEEMLREQSEERSQNSVDCACGKRAYYKKLSAVEIPTLYGRVKVLRPHYRCGACKQGVFPLDTAWRLGPGNTSPGVQDLLGACGGLDAYQGIPVLLHRVRPQVKVDVKTIERITQKLGTAIAAAAERITPAPPSPPVRGRYRRRRAPAAPIAAADETRPSPDAFPPVLAVAADGVMLPTRGGNKEARCGVIYTPHWNSGRASSATESLQKEFFATLKDRETLMARLCSRTLARWNGKDPLAALGDGAEWIWAGFAKHLPAARVDILDLFHVLERVALVAAVWHPATTRGKRQSVAWQEARKQALLEQGPGPLLRLLREWNPTNPKATEVKEEQLGYFERQQGRMDYPRYLRLGLPIGSGAVEGTCKHLVCDRFRGTGMRWKVDTAEPVLHLRAALLTRPSLDLRAYA